MSAYGVIDNMDGKQRIMYRLFRDCTKYTNGHRVKDLNRLNRDLSKVIFIDFDPESAKYNPENLLLLPKWDGDMDDVALVDLAELLKSKNFVWDFLALLSILAIYVSDVDDVRPVLQFYSGFDSPTKEFRRRATELSVMEQQRKEQQQDQSSLRKYAGFFGLRRHNI
jgi:import inner membrane translocase subunit TIM50